MTGKTLGSNCRICGCELNPDNRKTFGGAYVCKDCFEKETEE